MRCVRCSPASSQLVVKHLPLEPRSVQADAGLLTNSEVLSVLKDREADKQPVVSKALPSEIQVYSALEQRGTALNSREDLQACIDGLKEFNLRKEEVLQLLNHAPTDSLTTFLCLQQAVEEERVTEDDLGRIAALLTRYFKR